MVEKKAYNCILSQVLSPCGDVLVCGNIYGDISIFELGSVLDDGGHVLHKAAKRIFSSPNREQVNSLASTAQFLIAGTCGAIFGWDWESVKNYKPELKWTIILPSARERLLETDVNTLLVTPGNVRQELYAGCGDNIIYAFNLEDGQLIRTLEGHSDYIHSLSTENRQMASASEDGTVRLWDMRQASITSKIEPHSEPKLARNNFGKWIGDVSITNDWMVCGGGPRCSLWHMRTMQMMTSFTEFSDFEVHISRIKGDSILCGGASSHFYQASFTGQLQSKMTTSAITLYTAVYSEVPRDVLTLAGSGNAVDVCTNFTYRHKVLNFYD